MFDFGFFEICVIGLVALVVVGPKRLPAMAKTAGMWLGRARRMVADVKQDIKRELDESELGDVSKLRTEFDKVSKNVKNAADDLVEDSGIKDATSSLKETFKEASPIKDEIDEVAGQIENEISGAKSAVAAKPKARKKATKKKTSKKKAAKKKVTKKKIAKKKLADDAPKASESA